MNLPAVLKVQNMRWRAASGLLLYLAAPCEAKPFQSKPPANPFLAASHNNQSHWNDAATDSVDLPMVRGHYCMTPSAAQIVPSDAMGIPAYMARIGGREIHWFFSGAMLRKLEFANGSFQEIDQKRVIQNFPDRVILNTRERNDQVDKIHQFLDNKDEKGLASFLQAQPNRLASAMEDQVDQGVLYSLFTRGYGFIGANARGLVKIDNRNEDDPLSKLQEPQYSSLPETLFDDEKVRNGTNFARDTVFGLGMTFNGFLVVSTVGGRIATVDRNSLQVVDSYGVQNAGELFTNSFATSDEVGGGAVYVASNRRMYRLIVGANGKISADEAQQAWSAPYDAGERLPVGKIADGTGSTPTLMGFAKADDKLVVLTDGAKKMRLVAFWRDRIPKGWKARPGFMSARIVDQKTVEIGPDFPVVQSEQSVVVYGNHAFVLNSIPAPSTFKPYPIQSTLLRGLLLGTTRPLPRGIAMYRWQSDAKRWRALWSRRDIGTVATVPMISGRSRMVVLNGTLGDKLGSLYHLGFNIDTGRLDLSIAAGSDPRFNGAFTGLKTDDRGRLVYTTLHGLVRFDTERMFRVNNSPEVNPKGCPAR
ncbi:MAG: hypothetical protein RLZZ561_1075 [Pseudomonadota bacterium]|jgi:hypothetical protein